MLTAFGNFFAQGVSPAPLPIWSAELDLFRSVRRCSALFGVVRSGSLEFDHFHPCSGVEQGGFERVGLGLGEAGLDGDRRAFDHAFRVE